MTFLHSKTREARQIFQDFHQIRIRLERFCYQFPQIFQSRGYAHNELSLLLDKTSEAIGPKNLKGSEKDGQTKSTVKSDAVNVGIFLIFLESFQIAVDHPFLEPLRVAEPCLPYEGRDVVIYRASSTSLEINKIRLPVLDHHVSRIEIAIEEGIAGVLQKVLSEKFEFVLQTHFVKLQSARLEEAVLEVVQVKHYHPVVKGRLRIAH